MQPINSSTPLRFDFISNPGTKPEDAAIFERRALCHLQSEFSSHMLLKILTQFETGRRGWNDPVVKEALIDSLFEHAKRGDGQWIDVANLAMFLWNMEKVPRTFYDKNGDLLKIGETVYLGDELVVIKGFAPEGVLVEAKDGLRREVFPDVLEKTAAVSAQDLPGFTD